MLRYNRNRARGRFFPLFSPRELFYGSVPGAWYDPTDLSTMFQDSAGTTPVTAVEQPVGLIFDKSQGTPAARYNLLTQSEDFSQAVWAKGNITVSANSTTAPDGTLTADTYTVTATLSAISYQDAVVSGSAITYSIYAKQNSGPTDANTFAVYNLTTATVLSIFTINYATGAISHSVGSGATATAVGNGWWRLSVTHSSGVSAGNSVRVYPCFIGNSETAGESAFLWGAQLQTGSTATTYQRITSGAGGEWTPGNHASQSTAASRPTYRARYNLLTRSEELQNSAWSNAAPSADCTVATNLTAPDGTATGQTLTPSAGGTAAQRRQFINAGAATYTFSVYLKQGTSARSQIIVWRETFAALLSSTAITWSGGVPTVGGVIAGTWQTPEAVGNGWYRVTGTLVAPAGVTQIFVGVFPDNLAGTGTLGVWGAQLLTAADVTATGNAYQRIAAATVYDTAPIFRPYLAFDGLDDSLATSAINFTSTTKMSVFSGVTKGAEAVGMIAELSADASANAGFYVAAFTTARYGSQTGPAFILPSTYAAPITNVFTTLFDLSQATVLTQIVPRLNGVVNQTGAGGAASGLTPFGTFPLFIGRRNNATFPFNGRIYSLIVRGAASSTTEIIDAETWVNARTGGY